MAMIEVLRSGVNTWECDQMGHLNVRHYFARANQGLVTLALQLGLLPSQLRKGGLSLRARDQHVRFVREMRPGVYYTVCAGVLQSSPDGLQVYEEIRFLHSGEVAASILSELELVESSTARTSPFSDAVLKRADALSCALPAEYAPRGVARTPPRAAPLYSEALDKGLVGAYLAPVQPEDCDAYGVMHEAAFMARVSDGIGHFFHATRPQRATGIGGAALEYRYVFHQRPRLGDVIEVRSGLKAVGQKTSHLCHWIFNLETGRCAATSEAVAVSFDLTTRKAIEISPEARADMEQRVVPGLSV
jgi:acyl-CoA thioester hydrolase